MKPTKEKICHDIMDDPNLRTPPQDIQRLCQLLERVRLKPLTSRLKSRGRQGLARRISKNVSSTSSVGKPGSVVLSEAAPQSKPAAPPGVSTKKKDVDQYEPIFNLDALLEMLSKPNWLDPNSDQPPRKKRRRIFSCPKRHPLLPLLFYTAWCNHIRSLRGIKHLVDDKPPPLFPELYLKPRRLDFYAHLLEDNLRANKELVTKINLIQRTGGLVDCWNRSHGKIPLTQRMCFFRQQQLNEIRKANLLLYSKILLAKSDQMDTKTLNSEWIETKQKLINSALLPFVLFETDTIDHGMKDPSFDKPANVFRPKVVLDIWVANGAKMGRVVIELFRDIAPMTCDMFLKLVKGDNGGHAYTGTRFFRIVPNLYCRGGDVSKDNGFGLYTADDLEEPPRPENFVLNHSIPGVLSMAVTNVGEVSGQFNIIFKPLPQFDKKHVVFGRIIAGPALTLERISAQGMPLGTTTADVVIRYCGYYTASGTYKEGNQNTIKFPPRSRKKQS